MRTSVIITGFAGSLVVWIASCRDLPVQPQSRVVRSLTSAEASPQAIVISSDVTALDLGANASASSINDAGYVVGQFAQTAARWSPSGELLLIRAPCVGTTGLTSPPLQDADCMQCPNQPCTPAAHDDQPSAATSINNKGEIVGTYRYHRQLSPAGTVIDQQSGFFWSAERGFHDISYSGYRGVRGGGTLATTIYAISDSGLIGGQGPYTASTQVEAAITSFVADDPFGSGFMVSPQLRPGDPSTILGVNNRGEMVGWSQDPIGRRHAMFWSSAHNQLELAGPLASAINDSGVVVGSGYQWSAAGGYKLVPSLGSVAAINNDGYMAGTIFYPSGTVHAALWTPDYEVLDLGTLGGAQSYAYGLNSHLQVAGKSLDAAGVWHAVRWDVRVPANLPPTADAGGPYSGYEGSPVQFQGKGSDPDGDKLSFSWTFGDGASSNAFFPTHVYADNGNYTARLTVTDSKGLTASSEALVTIANVAPTVRLTAPSPITSGDRITLPLAFSDPGINDMPWRYLIDWGIGTALDRSTSSQAQTIYASSPPYCHAGDYNIRAEVIDKDGGAGDATTVLTVSRLAVPIDVVPSTLNIRSRGKMTVAVLSTTAFDARTIDLTTVTLGDGLGRSIQVVEHGNGKPMVSYEDFDRDGRDDLVLHFDRSQLEELGILRAPSSWLTLEARMTDGCREVAGREQVLVLEGK